MIGYDEAPLQSIAQTLLKNMTNATIIDILSDSFTPDFTPDFTPPRIGVLYMRRQCETGADA